MFGLFHPGWRMKQERHPPGDHPYLSVTAAKGPASSISPHPPQSKHQVLSFYLSNVFLSCTPSGLLAPNCSLSPIFLLLCRDCAKAPYELSLLSQRWPEPGEPKSWVQILLLPQCCLTLVKSLPFLILHEMGKGSEQRGD